MMPALKLVKPTRPPSSTTSFCRHASAEPHAARRHRMASSTMWGGILTVLVSRSTRHAAVGEDVERLVALDEHAGAFEHLECRAMDVVEVRVAEDLETQGGVARSLRISFHGSTPSRSRREDYHPLTGKHPRAGRTAASLRDCPAAPSLSVRGPPRHENARVHPGARPFVGMPMPGMSKPARASSHDDDGVRVPHLAGASSSRPHTGVGTRGATSSTRRAMLWSSRQPPRALDRLRRGRG